MPARKVSEILGADNALGNLAAASRRLEQLQRIYLETVPAAFSRASRVGSARGGVATIIASNGAMAAKLRQMTPRILDGFKRHGLEFNSMRIEVQADAVAERPSAAGAMRLSPAASSALEEALRTVPPSPLRDALKRLARRRG
ncbi:MAG: DciA family protein [Burkholderiales bacterium]